MAGRDMSTTVDCAVRAFTDDFEFLTVSTQVIRVPQLYSCPETWKAQVIQIVIPNKSRYIPRRCDQDSRPSVDWRLS